VSLTSLHDAGREIAINNMIDDAREWLAAFDRKSDTNLSPDDEGVAWITNTDVWDKWLLAESSANRILWFQERTRISADECLKGAATISQLLAFTRRTEEAKVPVVAYVRGKGVQEENKQKGHLGLYGMIPDLVSQLVYIATEGDCKRILLEVSSLDLRIRNVLRSIWALGRTCQRASIANSCASPDLAYLLGWAIGLCKAQEILLVIDKADLTGSDGISSFCGALQSLFDGSLTRGTSLVEPCIGCNVRALLTCLDGIGFDPKDCLLLRRTTEREGE